MRILHIITSLDTGGAQGVLINILKELKDKGTQQWVVCMKPNGELAQQVNDLGIRLCEVPFQPRNFLNAKSKVDAIISSFQPQIIQSWLYHADFLTIFLHNPKKIPIIWGIHHSFESIRQNRLKFLTKIIVRVNAAFSHTIPNQIICCSHSALKSHANIGYSASKLIYIPNGIDADRFIPNPNARTILREELGLAAETRLVGYIARLHPQKNHKLFFLAANLLLEKNKNVHFILAGAQVVTDNPQINKWMGISNLPDHFHLLGKRSDLPMITAGLDLATLTSSGDEAFPLTMLEAMACEIPCVATDVGDVKQMLGSSGVIVPPQNPEALAESWLLILNRNADEKAALGKSLRERVLKHFTNKAMADQYFKIYTQSISISSGLDGDGILVHADSLE